MCLNPSPPDLLLYTYPLSASPSFALTMSLLEARVKTVLSGDTLILTHVINRSQERTLILAYVSAPRLRREGDEVKFDISPGCPLHGFLVQPLVMPLCGV